MELCKKTIYELNELLKRREISCVDITKSFLERIKEHDSSINAYITVCEEKALLQAKEADNKLKEGKITHLTGIPIGVKDNYLTRDILTTCASKILSNYVPPYNATVVDKIFDAGGVVIGKTNLDEFAMGSSNESSYYGAVKNPWDLARTPGGSSGGSGAAVASCEAVAALGTDTGGSVRLPASFCNVTSLKPTYGRVSRFGIVAYASSLDQVGPIGRDVRDLAILSKYIFGYDPLDSTSIRADIPDYLENLPKDPSEIKGMKIGIPKEYFFKDGIDPDVLDSLSFARDIFVDMGCEVSDVSLPHTEYAIATYYIIATAEASSNLARYDGIRFGYRTENHDDLAELYMNSRKEGFGEEVKRRIMLGTYVLSAGYYDAYYAKAQRVRTLIKEDFDRVFSTYDLILVPTSPTTAFKLGERVDDPLKMYLSDIFTISVNLAGIPSLALPCGFSKSNLPIGMQLLGSYLSEAKLFQAGHAFQLATDFHKYLPPLNKKGDKG